MKINPIEQFEQEKKQRIKEYEKDGEYQELSQQWVKKAFDKKYMYNFSWMGRPIIQTPIDMLAMQEIIWEVKPDLILETGIAHGGSLIYHASLLELMGHGEVVGIDIDIRQHNRQAIEEHPMFKRITLLEGSSLSDVIAQQVYDLCKNKKKILVVLDSNHTHEHVIKELQLYAHLTTVNSYCVVFDTIVEDLPKDYFENRPWNKGDNPKTAVWEFLKSHDEFEIDKQMQNKLLITVAPDGFLKRVK
jgi:cephalosporin hydroxylase